MAELKTPGVYVQEIRTLPTSVAPVATAIPAFIGYTKNAVANPVRITSMTEFVEVFGGPNPTDVTVTVTGTTPTVSLSTVAVTSTLHTLYYAMQMYFSNGGGPCWVASAGQYFAGPLVALPFTNALDLIKREDEPTLLVIPQASKIASHALPIAMLTQCAELQDRFALIDLIDNATITTDASSFRTGIGTVNLNYGAAYYPYLKTALTYSDDAITFSGGGTELNGKTLATVLAQAALESGSTPISNAVNPILGKIREKVAALSITLPPSSTMAGVYASVDRTRGVWKAPANISLNNVIEPTIKINDEDQQDLNVHTTGKSINAIRSFTGKGVMVWGARTLDGNSNEWRYVPVRRLFIMMEESIRKATEFVVFEPNDANTWALVKGMTQNFLANIWRQGALAGAKPEDAFFVKVGLGETMTPQDILEGRMIVEIGVAAVRPAEFIVLRFSHKLQES